MNKPIRILNILSNLSFGGVQSFVMNYYKNIDRSKIQFDFVVQTQDEGFFDEEILKLGGKIHKVTPLHINKKKFKVDLYNVLKNNSDYKVVHVHQNFMNLIPLMVAKKAKVPLRISHSHSSYPSNSIITKFKRIIFRNLITNYATDYFACSKISSLWLYGKKNSNCNRSKIIPNAIDTSEFIFKMETRNKVRKQLGLFDKQVVIHVGMFTDAKNHNYLLEIFNHMQKMNKNTSLLLVGDGKNKEAIVKKARENGTIDNIIFLGEKKNVNEYLMAADYFLFPSKYEGLGLSLIEAQISGLKCWASDNVPKEANLFGDVSYKSIEISAYEWANSVLNSSITRNIKSSKEIVNSGYDIRKEAISLQKYYLDNISLL